MVAFCRVAFRLSACVLFDIVRSNQGSKNEEEKVTKGINPRLLHTASRSTARGGGRGTMGCAKGVLLQVMDGVATPRTPEVWLSRPSDQAYISASVITSLEYLSFVNAIVKS